MADVAHFTEHMLFMGSEEFPAESEYNRYIEDHGGYANAYTTTDHTVFYFTIQPHGLLGGLDRISQFFIAPVLFLSNFTNIVIGSVCFRERTQCSQFGISYGRTERQSSSLVRDSRHHACHQPPFLPLGLR